VAVASAGPYASLHLASETMPATRHLVFFTGRMPSCHPNNSVKALKAHTCSFCSTSPFLHSYSRKVRQGPKKLKFGGSRVYLARQSTAFHNPSPNLTHMCSFCSTSPFLHSYTGQVKPGPQLLKFGDTQKTSVTGYLTGGHSIKSPDPVYQTWNQRQCQGHQ